MEALLSEFKEDLEEFREMTDKFYAKEVNVKTYKGFSGGFGSYAQRGGDASMLRLRLPGGRLPKEKLKFVAEVIEKYQIDKAHFTTCQTIQLHDLGAETVCEIMEKALEVGIITRGGGGDFPRNVMVSPLSGVETGEYFDVMPYVEAVSDFLLGKIKTVKMPRKLKVCFSNSPANAPHATLRDLGFTARLDGLFDVYGAGGLGNNPRMGVKVAQGVAPNEVLYYVQAMIDTFCAYGNYENRGKARTRYMVEALGGEEAFRAAYLEKLARVRENEKNVDVAGTAGDSGIAGTVKHGGIAKAAGSVQNGRRASLMLDVEASAVTKADAGVRISGPRVIAQKQPGLYAVSYHPIGGLPLVTKFAELYDCIKDMEEVEIRIAPDETIYIINLNGSEAERVLAVTEDGANSLLESSVSCIGASVCQVGLRDSQGLLRNIIEAVSGEHFADGVLPRIHISGCTSSCGTHQIGRLGFHGGVKRVDGVTKPAYTFHVNGREEQGEERFGEQWGSMLEEEIPDFFVELGREISASGTTFETWMEENPRRLREIAGKYLH